MSKTILLTGATDGIGLETAKMLIEKGHHVLLHGRNPSKLETVKQELSTGDSSVETYVADLSQLDDVERLAEAIAEKHQTLDVLINNAGVLKAPNTITDNGVDIRFVVNTIAPYLLTKKLLPLMGTSGRVINLSSAAQAPVDLDALAGKRNNLSDMDAYSQSKLAITMWSRHLAQSLNQGPIVIPVNPGSLLASKMVKDGFDIQGNDISIGADILVRLSLDDEFADKSGEYFDNDSGRFASPHPDGLDDRKCQDVVDTIEAILG